MKWIIELRTELALRPLANHQHFHNLIDTFLVIFDQKLVWLVILTPELAQLGGVHRPVVRHPP